MSGAAPLSKELVEELVPRLPPNTLLKQGYTASNFLLSLAVYNLMSATGYGMTELSPVSHATHYKHVECGFSFRRTQPIVSTVRT